MESTPDLEITADGAAAPIRTILQWTLLLGMIGTAAELILLEHLEGFWQQVPVALLAAGVVALGWHMVASSRATVRALQATMLLFLLSGGIGVVQHYQGNVEFELEMSPTMGGMELFRKTMMGAFPVLAPGAMALLGAVGLAHAYRHPASTPGRVRRSRNEATVE